MDEIFNTLIICMDETSNTWEKLELKTNTTCDMAIYIFEKHHDLSSVYERQIQSMTTKPMQFVEHEHFASKFH
jgi:hypothetical protein